MLRPISEPTHVFGNASTATIPIVAAMTSPNRTVAVYKLLLTASAATNVTIQDSSGAALSEVIPLTGSKALVLDQLDDNDPWFTTAPGLGVQIAQSGSANIGFDAYYLGGPFYTLPPSGVHVPVFVPTTWNQADSANITLSNGNLTGTGIASGGARAVASATSGKFYWENTYVTLNTNSLTCGIALASGSLTSPGAGICLVARATGNITLSGGAGGVSIGTIPVTSVVGIAVDCAAQLIWFRIAPSGNWNGSGTANPATGAGGYSFVLMSGAVYPYLGVGGGDVMTTNFGASAFTGTVPTGFTAGWGVLQ